MRNFKKIIISVLVFVSAIFALSLTTPLEVHSEDGHSHNFTNGYCSSCGQCNGQHGDGWTALTADGGTLTTGYYYLEDDLILNSGCSFTVNGTVTVCLNGHVLAGSGYKYSTNKNIFTISAGFKLDITDCNGTIYGGTVTSHHFTQQDDQDGLWVWDESEQSTQHIVNGGVITGGKNTNSGGAIVLLNNTYLNIYHGNFIGNQCVYDGVRRGNGGVIYTSVNGHISIYDGYFAGNLAENGGVFYSGSTSKTYKPEIKMYGSIMEHNVALSAGGAIASSSSKGKIVAFNNAYLLGGTIRNNIANRSLSSAFGGGVQFYGKTYFGGDIVISDNLRVTGKTGDVENTETSNYFFKDVYNSSSNYIDFSAEIAPTDGMNVGISSSESVDVENPLTGSCQISNAVTSNYQRYFFSDDDDLKVKGIADTSGKYILSITPPTHTHESTNVTFYTELTEDYLETNSWVLSTGNYYLEKNVSVTNSITIPTGTTVKLCLNGYGIIGNQIEGIFNVASGSTFELYDCQPDAYTYYFVDNDSNGSFETLVDSNPGTNCCEVNGGFITGGKSTTSSGSAINVSGTFKMYGGTIVGNDQRNATHTGGGALNLAGGSCEINGGGFLGNYSENGGAIYFSGTNCLLTINDSTFKKNKANKGGAIYSSADATIEIKDGLFQYNSATGEGGGAIYTEEDSVLRLTGDGGLQIKENNTEGCGGAIYVKGEFKMIAGNINNNHGVTASGVYVASCNASQITVGESARIENNAYDGVQSNLYLCDATSDKLITVVYGDGAKIGITSEKDPANGAFVISTEANNDYHDFIVSDNSSYKVIDRVVNSKHILKLAITLKVTYHPFGNYEGTQPVVMGSVPTDDTDYVEEDLVTIKSIDTKTFKRVGYKFLGWSNDPDSTDVLGETFVISENTNLYAVWQEKITITFDTSQQEYIYNVVSYGYEIDHELESSFQIRYYLEPDKPDGFNLWGVTNVGTYNIEVLRAEDDTYKALDVYINEAIKISPKTATPDFISNIDDKVFTRSAIEIDASTLVVRYNNEPGPLVYGEDFTVAYENNINVGQATIKINGIGNYGFETSKTFNITSKVINPTISNIETAYYSKEGSEPTITVKDGDFTLTVGTDYTVAYSNNLSVGTGHLVVTCCGNYSGTVESDFSINKRNITPVIGQIDEQTYNGNEICPSIDVYDDEYLLEEGVEYDAVYSNNVQAGTAKVVVTLKGNYDGSATANYTINPKEVTINWENLEFEYDGLYHVPTAIVSGAVGNDTIEISVTGKQINAGIGYIATAYFTEIQNNYVFKDNVVPTQSFVINKATTVVTDLTIENWVYGQSAKTPSANTNYGTINYSYSDSENGEFNENPSINAGTYYVKAYVEEDDNWLYAEQVISFTINKKTVGIDDCSPNNFTYNGKSQISNLYAKFLDINGNFKDLVVCKVENQNQVTKTDFKDAGIWNVYFAFKTDEDNNNYAFTYNPVISYEIKKKSITPIISSIDAQGYTGSEIYPTVQVYDGDQLVAVEDGYEVEYTNNVQVGTATVTVTMNTNYEGTKTTTFVIEPKVLTVNWSNLQLVYNGFEQIPTATLVGVIEGDVVNYEVIGSQIDVGKEYVATVQFVGEHNNYKFENDVNPTNTFSIIQATSVITYFAIQNWTYKEIANEPSADTNFGEVAYLYSKYQNNDFTNKVPTDAGDYFVKAYVEETDNWSYAEEILSFTIYKRSITPIIDDIDDQTYSRSAITPQVFVYDDEYLMNGTTEYDVEYVNNVHAGTATVNVTLKGNYVGENSINFTIKRVVLSINWSNLVITYDGQPHVPTATLVGVIAGDNVEIIISGAKTDVGTNYIASARFAVAQNDYEFINSICLSQAFSIVQATTIISNLSIENWAYKDVANAPTANNNFGTVNYAYSKFAASGFVPEVPTEAGNYYVKAYVEETNNWSYAEEVVSFTINKRNITPQINSIDSQTYNGNEICPEVFVYDLEYLMNGETEYDVEYSNNVQAGNATVTVTLKGNYQGSNSIDFVIDPVVLTVEWSNLEFTYDGDEHAPTAIAVGMVNGETVEVVVTGGMIDAGEDYVATAEFAQAQNNYIFVNNENPTTTFTILQATTSISDFTIENWTYGQVANSPTANNNFGTIKYAYSKLADSGFVSEVPTEAGNYYVKAYVEETANWSYAEQVIAFTINKMIVTASYCEDNFTYDGTSQANKLSASYVNKDSIVTVLKVKSIYNVDNTDTDFREARVWYVVFTFATDEELNNYSFGESGEVSSTTFTMNKADYNMESVAWDYESGKFTYDENYHTVLIIPESLPEGVTVVKYNNNSFIEAGTYYASVKEFAYDTTNYNYPDYHESFEWVINKANYDLSNVTWDYETGKFTYDGNKKTVKLINLPESISVKYSTNDISNCNSRVDAGEYETCITTIYYDEVNYNEPDSLFNEICYWEIAQATTTITGLAIENWTYGENANAPTANTNFGTINYKYSNSIDGTYETNVPTEAGVYYVKAYVEETNNWSYCESILEFNINKLVVNAIFCEDNFTYNGTSQANKLSAQYLDKDSKSVSLKIESISNVDNSDSDFKDARTWTVVFTFVTEEEVNNYSFGESGEYTSYDYHMKKADYDMKGVAWNYQDNLVYDGTEKSVELNNLPDGVTVAKYANNTSTNAGKFTASVVEFDYDKANYNYPQYTTTCTWEVKKATYDMTNAAWNYSVPFTYSGEEKSVTVTGLPKGVTVKTYANNKKTSAGQYTASVVEFNYDTTNYNAPTIKTCSWVINKADYDMSKVAWNYSNAFVYDKTEKKVELIGLPTGVTATYSNNAKTNVGKYEAKVTLVYDAENYEPISFTSCKWEIVKANFDLTNMKWNYTNSFVYDKTEKNVEVIGLPEGLTVKTYAGNKATVVGKYVASVSEFSYDTANYNAPSINSINWEIVKANFDLTNMKWDYTTPFVYDNSEKKVEVIGLPEGLTVKTYAGNKATVVGKYVASVTEFSYDTANYNAPTILSVNWEIKKATYDMSNVKWDYVNPFVYDKIEKKVELIGLPEGVTANYSENAKTNAGNYEASATFNYDTANYNEVTFDNCNWTINKTNYVINVKFDSLSIAEDGQSHMIQIEGTLPEGVNVEYYCNDQVFSGASEVGSYEITAKFSGDYANYNEIDDMHATLTIKATEIKVPVTEGKTVPDVKIETEAGFPEDVVIEFSISTDDTEEKKTSSFDYEANKDKETKLKFNEEVGFVFELKLQREVNGVMVDIQPTDLDGVTSIKVKIHIPDDVDIDEITRIIHVHSENDITEIEFDASKVDEDRYYEIEITKLSEFAFIHKKDCYAHWGLIAILAIYLSLFVVWVFVLKHHKFDIPSIVGTAIYGVSWFVFIFTACCYKCIIFAVIDFLVLIFALMLLGTNGAENLARFLFTKKNEDDKNNQDGENIVIEDINENQTSNKEELKRFKESEHAANIKTESYEDKKLDEMFERVMRDNIAPEVYDGEDKIELVGIVFANGKKIYKYSPNGYQVNVGDRVIVEGQNGSKYGRIVQSNYYGKPNQGFTIRNIINVLNK